MASRYGIETDNWRYADNSPVTSGRGRQANMLNAGLAAYQAVRGFQGDQADSEAADAAKAAQQEQYRSTDTTPIARENYTQDIDEASGAGLGYRLKPEAAAAVESYGRGEDFVPNGGVVDPTYKQQYGLGASPTTFRDTQYTPAEKRTAGLQARADFYAGDSRIGSADKAEKYSGMLEEAQARGLQRQLTQAQIDALPDEATARRLRLESLKRDAEKDIIKTKADREIADLYKKAHQYEPGSDEARDIHAEISQKVTATHGVKDGAAYMASMQQYTEKAREIEVKKREDAWWSAAKNESSAVERYNKDYKDGSTAKVVVGANGMRQLIKVGPDGNETPLGKPYKSWDEGGRANVLSNIDGLAKKEYELNVAHEWKLKEIKARGDQQVRYATALRQDKEVKMTPEQKTDLEAASKAVQDASDPAKFDQKTYDQAVHRFNGVVRTIGVANKNFGLIPQDRAAPKGSTSKLSEMNPEAVMKARAEIREELTGDKNFAAMSPDAKIEEVDRRMEKRWGTPRVKGVERTERTSAAGDPRTGTSGFGAFFKEKSAAPATTKPPLAPQSSAAPTGTPGLQRNPQSVAYRHAMNDSIPSQAMDSVGRTLYDSTAPYRRLGQQFQDGPGGVVGSAVADAIRLPSRLGLDEWEDENGEKHFRNAYENGGFFPITRSRNEPR